MGEVVLRRRRKGGSDGTVNSFMLSRFGTDC